MKCKVQMQVKSALCGEQGEERGGEGMGGEAGRRRNCGRVGAVSLFNNFGNSSVNIHHGLGFLNT